MNSAWQAFLARQGANLVNDRVTGFGAPAKFSADDNIIADLSHLALLEVDGEDAMTFLQGQVTNDVKLLNGSNSHYAGYCNPKGRMLAMFLAFAYNGHIQLQFNGELKEATLKRLKMYVLRSKVTISDRSDDIVRIGIAGAQAADLLQPHLAELPAAPHQITSLEQATIIRLPGATPRYQIFTSAERAIELWEALQPQCQPVSAERWDWLDIQAGIPDVSPGTVEAFVPQMLNLDLLGGISFKKGCYTGQEIVARTHYLGKVKRRTHLAHIDSTTMPNPGDIVTTADGSDAGLVVKAAPAPDGGFDLLAELRLESVETGALSVTNAGGGTLLIGAQPYVL